MKGRLERRGWVWGMALCFLLFGPALEVEGEPILFRFLPDQKLKIVERADLRRYENGRYVGLSFRELRGVLEKGGLEGGDSLFSGTFYLGEETVHDNRRLAKRVLEAGEVRFSLSPGGAFKEEAPSIFPTLKGLPFFPEKAVAAGESWKGTGQIVLDPFRDGTVTRAAFLCEYRYQGEEAKGGERFSVIRALFAVRYRKGQDLAGDPRLLAASGSHRLTINYDPRGRRPVFMSDQVDETYELEEPGKESSTVQFKGFVLTWFDPVTPLPRTELAAGIRRALEEKKVGDVEVEERREGLALTLNRIHFIADRAEVLADEMPRLKALAECLKTIPGRSFLVVGHTARKGSEESQLELSVSRAKAIVDFLVSAGIKAERFLFEGRGGLQPVAPNDTEENMARNRRVEVVILED